MRPLRKISQYSFARILTTAIRYVEGTYVVPSLYVFAAKPPTIASRTRRAGTPKERLLPSQSHVSPSQKSVSGTSTGPDAKNSLFRNSGLSSCPVLGFDVSPSAQHRQLERLWIAAKLTECLCAHPLLLRHATFMLERWSLLEEHAHDCTILDFRTQFLLRLCTMPKSTCTQV
jgi:hypothetical protein